MHPMSLSGWSANATSLALIVALASAPARAQNIDEGKSGAKLFAESCANCHNSARGLAKDRLSVTLGYYLGQHYTTNSASAQALAAYLQSVDAARSKPQPAAGKPGPVAQASTAPRPPAAIPGR